MRTIFKICMGIILMGSFVSCKKYLEVGEPKTQLTNASLFDNDGTATGAMLAIYAQMESQGLLYNLTVNTGLSADEFKLNLAAPAHLDLASNNLTADNTLTEIHWMSYYQMIYQANAVLEGLQSGRVTEAVQKQLRGEALLVRSFFLFYLANLYGDVPLVLSTNYESNATIARKSVGEVLAVILNDLTEAENLLDENYKSAVNAATIERVRPNRAAAQALLARIYLYKGDWVKAEQYASLVIGNSSLYELSSNLNDVFLKNNREQIWQIQPVLPDFNTFAGASFVIDGPPSTVYFDPGFIAEFQPADQRLPAWIKIYDSGSEIFHFPFKYKQGYGSTSIVEYTSVLRLSEQYLVRAEARAMLDKLLLAEEDLNRIRTRAGLSPISGLSKENLIDAVHLERKLELFAEAGDRWFNLKRLGRATEVLSIVKGSNWNETDQLYPVPQNELLRNPALTQNPGY